jgi:hypothetical protein
MQRSCCSELLPGSQIHHMDNMTDQRPCMICSRSSSTEDQELRQPITRLYADAD